MAAKHTIKPRWEVDAALARSNEIPMDVKAVPIWRSSDGLLLGYYPAIFGPNRWANYTCLMPAFPNIDIGSGAPTGLYQSADAAMLAWESSPATELANAHLYNMAITDAIAQRIRSAGLFRNPLLAAPAIGAGQSKAVDNPWEDTGEREKAQAQ